MAAAADFGVPGNGNGVTNAGSKLAPLFHLYTVLAVVVFAILIFVAWGHNDNVHAWARLPSWLSNTTTLGLVTLVALVLASYATTLASQRAVTRKAEFTLFRQHVTVGALFVVAGLLLVIVALLVYRTYDFWAAFWLALIALIGVSVHAWLCNLVRPAYGLLVLPLVALLAVITYYLWYMASDSSDVDNGAYDVNSITYTA